MLMKRFVLILILVKGYNTEAKEKKIGNFLKSNVASSGRNEHSLFQPPPTQYPASIPFGISDGLADKKTPYSEITVAGEDHGLSIISSGLRNKEIKQNIAQSHDDDLSMSFVPSGDYQEFVYDDQLRLAFLDSKKEYCLTSVENDSIVVPKECTDDDAMQVWIPSIIPETYDWRKNEAYFRIYNTGNTKNLDVYKLGKNWLVTGDEDEENEKQIFGPIPVHFFNNFYSSYASDVEFMNKEKIGGNLTTTFSNGNATLSAEDKVCQTNPESVPHMAGRWLEGFPNESTPPVALCNGVITSQENGDICVQGRVTFQQLLDHLSGAPMLVSSSSTVSINGLAITGVGNLGIAGTWAYIYDYITSYTIAGKTYIADTDMINNMFAASHGTIDGFCLDSSIREGPEYYQVKVKSYPSLKRFTSSVNELVDATLIFISFYAFTAEFHTSVEEGIFDEKDVFKSPEEYAAAISQGPRAITNEITQTILRSLRGMFGLGGTNDLTIAESIPGTFSSLGLIRSITYQGVYRTRDWPNPVYEGEDEWAEIEQVQMDTEWKTLIALIEGGFFSRTRPPINLMVGAKHIYSNENSIGCFKEETAGLGIGGPPGTGDAVDRYASKLYEAIEEVGGTIMLHFGKRIPNDKAIVQGALAKLESCGVELDIEPARCIHPMCRRTEQPSAFEWPAEYYSS